ncbi:hypothetical protein DOY81_006899 [Sarcophaga bullata]|nr:hypothetical protein DOY81_006899 [Sarcophaga bullata]
MFIFSLVATFTIVNILFNPAKKEITNAQAQYNSQTQPIVKSHKNQHQQVREYNLYEIK